MNARGSGTRILVTGGTGFLGRCMVRKLVGAGERVRVLAHSRPDPGVLPDECEILVGDVRDEEPVRRAAEGVEIAIHLVSNFRHPGTDREAHAINVVGTRHLLEAARRAGVDQVIHCSTVGVHGSVREVPATEESPLDPGDPYQRTKLEAEREARAFGERTGLPVTVIRPIPMYGPGDRRTLKLFRMVNSGWYVRVGDGRTLFQLSHVEDVAEGFLLSLRNPAAIGETFLVGGGPHLALNQLVSRVAEALGVEYRTLQLPLRPLLVAATLCEWAFAPFPLDPPLHRRRVRFYTNDRAFSTRKAREVLGYEPKISLEDGLARTARWYREAGWL